MTRLLLRPGEVAVALSCGRTKTYELIGRGAIRSVRIDGSIRVPVGAVEEYVAHLESQAATAA